MPFYEYECPKCGYRDEVLQKISDAPLKKCPSCGKSGLIKLMSAPVFRLKGSGWYETDFKSDKEKKRNLLGEDKEESKSEKPDSKADAKADPKADPKADSKPESKAEVPKPAAKPTANKKPAARRTKAKPAARKGRR